MSRPNASRLFDSGLEVLVHAKAMIYSQNYEDVLVEAMRCLDRAVELTARDDPGL
jgi:hypothetical protein